MKIKQKYQVMWWAFKLAWKINSKMLIVWLLLSLFIAFLPSLVLSINKIVIGSITAYIQMGNISYHQIFRQIVLLGIVMTLLGLSSRFNVDLVYMMMYDSYYVGMQEVLMDHINKIGMSELLKKEINDQYNDSFVRAGSLTNYLSSCCILCGKVTGIIMILALTYNTSPFFCALSSLYTICVVLVNAKFINKLRWNTQKHQEYLRKSTHYEKMPADIGLAKEIRFFNLERIVLKFWKRSFLEIKNLEKERNIDIEKRDLLSNLCFYGFVIISMLFTIFFVFNKTMSIDTAVVIHMICMSLFTNTSGIVRTYMETDYGLFALEKQFLFINNPNIKLINEKAENETQEITNDIIFEARDLSFGYSSDTPVLKNINIRIRKGETVALVGLNGSGKTTLTKLLTGLFEPTSGIILFSGKPYSCYDIKFIRSKVGVFFQDAYLFHTPVSENVAYGDIENLHDETKIIDAIKKGGAENLINKLPYGLKTIMGRDVDPEGVELSGGERQLVCVSRTYMSNRDIMIFDEPAAKLDPLAELEQFVNIKKELKAKTAILISHRMGFARLADQIIVMQDGKVQECGTHDELLKQGGLYYEMFNRQAKWYKLDNKE
jgi:ATP-binding cassette subfamily B protein